MTRPVGICVAAGILAVSGLLVMWLDALSSAECHGRTIDKVEVAVTDSTLRSFVRTADVEKVLQEECGTLVGLRQDSVKLRGIESTLEGRGAILSSDVYTTPDGILHVEVTQREPVIMFDTGSARYYADRDGFMFPLAGDGDERVTVIDGTLPITIHDGFKGRPDSEEERGWLDGMISMMEWLKYKTTWAGAIKRISIDGDGELVLYPREGKERFLFGQPTDIAAKFSRMEDYYRFIVPSKDAGFYGTVNVKFDRQIVCTPANGK